MVAADAVRILRRAGRSAAVVGGGTGRDQWFEIDGRRVGLSELLEAARTAGAARIAKEATW